MSSIEFSNLIKSGRDTIAFLIGNGIHMYDKSVRKSNKMNWEELLLIIKKILDVTFMGEKPKEGLSNPEFFDLIELSYLDGQIVNEKENFHKSISDLITSCESIQIINNGDSFSYPQVSSNILHDNEMLSMLESNAIKKAKTRIHEKVNEIFNDFGIPKKSESVSFDELNFACDILYGGAKKFYIVKRIIKFLFENYSIGEWIHHFLRFAMSSNIPIMTTNYDETLSEALNLPAKCMNSDSTTQYKFPFETYFSNEKIDCPWESFGVWHINGLISFPQSIRIGYLDYADMFHEIQERLYKNNSHLKILNNKKIDNTWISIFFHRDIFIWGLSLDVDEYVIRWLLVERARYNIINKKKLKGWYAVRCEDNEPIHEGKKLFLNQVGIEIIYIDSLDLHENIWKELNTSI